MLYLLKAAKSWFTGGNMWVLWAGGAALAVVGLLWFRLDSVTDERDAALRNLGAAEAANQATVAATHEIIAANVISGQAVREAHARELAAARAIATLKAQVENDQSKPTGCAPSLADPAPAGMLRALRGVRGKAGRGDAH